MVGTTTSVETKDGSRREGRITAVNTETVQINGKSYHVPISFNLNNDPSDLLDFRMIKQMRVDG